MQFVYEQLAISGRFLITLKISLFFLMFFCKIYIHISTYFCCLFHRALVSAQQFPKWDMQLNTRWISRRQVMMTSSNGNFFRVTGLCAGNSPVTGEFLAQRPVTRSFDVFFDLRLNQKLNKQSWGWWFETLSRSLWRHWNEIVLCNDDNSRLDIFDHLQHNAIQNTTYIQVEYQFNLNQQNT